MLRCSLCYSKIAQTSEKYEVYFNIFPSECSLYSLKIPANRMQNKINSFIFYAEVPPIFFKDTRKRARNIKLA